MDRINIITLLPVLLLLPIAMLRAQEASGNSRSPNAGLRVWRGCVPATPA